MIRNLIKKLKDTYTIKDSKVIELCSPVHGVHDECSVTLDS